jgi:hypothetical protein
VSGLFTGSEAVTGTGWVSMVRRRSTVRFRKGAPQVSGVFRECIPDLFPGFPGQGEGQRFHPCAYLLVIGQIRRQLAGSGVHSLAIGGQDHHQRPPASLIRPSARAPGVHVEHRPAMCWLGAVLFRRPFGDVASRACMPRTGRRPQNAAGGSMGVAHVAVVRRGQRTQDAPQMRSADHVDLAPRSRAAALRPVMPM